MNKLELAHLAPYLPYNLLGYNEPPGEKRHRMLLTPFQLSKFDSYDSYGRFTGKRIQFFKPILKPMSDITEESLNALNIDQSDELQIWELKERRITYSMMGYGAVQHLLSNHFDVFGLIDQGLAISYKEAGL